MRINALSLLYVASALLALAAAPCVQPAAAQQKVGVNAAVNLDAAGTPPSGTTRKLVIGQEVVHNEHVTTDAKGQAQILFLDGSSMSIGPNADLSIDDFVYDTHANSGKLVMNVSRGAVRFVGGKLSKLDDAVIVHLATVTLGVRGGVFVADVQKGGKTEIIFIYGKAVSVSGQSGCTQDLYRPGFAVDISGGCPGAPHPAPPGAVAAIFAQLDGRAGGSGGARTVPTDATVANSPVPNTISNNLVTSVQQATAASAAFTTAPPVPTVAPPQVPQNQIQTTSSQSQPFVANPPPPTPPTPPTPPAPTPTPGPQPVAVQIAGLIKVAPAGSALGFTDQSATGRIPYTGTITYPPGSNLQNGTATGSAPNIGSVLTLSPLTAGTTTAATGTASAANGPSNGPVAMSADGNFFYGNLTGQNSGQLVFVMGGTPVSQSFYAPTSAPRILAFNVQPDFALANGPQSQTIPFLPSFAGGTQPNAVVSPLYVVAPANEQFGAFNANTNPNITSPRFMQASLAINGQGATQTSALAISTGVFATANAGSVYASGVMRGSFSTGGAPTRLNSGMATVPDANGNALFGGNSLDGFVLDQNQFSSGNPVQQLAASTSFGSSPTNYAFNQPVTSTSLPSGIGSSRTTQSLSGFFGGIMYPNTTSPYALTGANAIVTNAVNNRLFAVFGGGDLLTPGTSGINSATLAFGGPTATADGNRSAFVDDNTFAATESATVASQINGNNLPFEAPGQPGTRLAMVTSSAVAAAANSLLPAGVSFCQCQFLQWGYWTGELDQVNGTGNITRFDRGGINTWVAGIPTVTLPTVGSGTYSGAAIGSVVNAGASYMAAGGFNNTYNFGSNTGTVAINNFDGHNFSGTVFGSGGIYSGSIVNGGNNRQGVVSGSFYGPGAAETGGSFALQATSGPSYIASGIFAGKLTGPIR